jgi:hypothetical protein
VATQRGLLDAHVRQAGTWSGDARDGAQCCGFSVVTMRFAAL